jgi:diguanylate cyclase (GGDEF)-like protein
MKTNNNFRILIVDDEILNIKLAAAYLEEENYQISYALNAKGTFETISLKKVDLILLDINMPEVDGFEVCKKLKSEEKTKDIPIIFLTAQTDIEYISNAFKSGGADYISKPFNGIELKVRVKTQLQNLSYLEEIKHKQSKLAQLSITDPLTKLYNSLYFGSQIKSYLNEEKSFWVIYIKINNFNKINNLYGFDKANKIIKVFANMVTQASYNNAILARLYGVGFGILLKDYNIKTIKQLGVALSKIFLQHKELSRSINYSIIALSVDTKTTVPAIYKKLQTKIDLSSKSDTLDTGMLIVK